MRARDAVRQRVCLSDERKCNGKIAEKLVSVRTPGRALDYTGLGPADSPPPCSGEWGQPRSWEDSSVSATAEEVA